MLNKLLIEQTKSRPRKSNDNGQVEAKNGAVIRKHMGFDHIASEHAGSINAFYETHFNPYLNFHRPCAVPELKKDNKGKTVRTYKWYATPWEILRPTAIPAPRRRCAKPNGSCSSPSNTGELHDREGLRK